jgi:hypothetical protein
MEKENVSSLPIEFVLIETGEDENGKYVIIVNS